MYHFDFLSLCAENDSRQERRATEKMLSHDDKDSVFLINPIFMVLKVIGKVSRMLFLATGLEHASSRNQTFLMVFVWPT